MWMMKAIRESSLTGQSVMRPLFYHYQEDVKTFNIYDQFMYGESIMVCPIYRTGADHRMIYLPIGQWYDYWTEEKINGGKHIIKEAPIDVLPLYIKAGSIIPQDEIMDYIDENEEIMDIHFYLGSSGEYILYLDDGISFDYEKGIFSQVKFVMREYKNKIEIKSMLLKNNYKIPKIKVYIHGINEKKYIKLKGKRISYDNLRFKSFELEHEILNIEIY